MGFSVELSREMKIVKLPFSNLEGFERVGEVGDRAQAVQWKEDSMDNGGSAQISFKESGSLRYRGDRKSVV